MVAVYGFDSPSDIHFPDPSASDYWDQLDPHHDTGWFGSSLVSSIGNAVSSAVHSVEKGAEAVGHAAFQAPHLVQEGLSVLQKSPAWDMIKTGVSFIPGVGQAVPAAMAGLAALGSGKSLKDAAVAAARNAIPGGPAVMAAFDVAHGLLEGKSPADSVVAAVRDQLPGGAVGRAVFDAGVAIAKGHGMNPDAIAAIRKNVPGGAEGVAAFNRVVDTWKRAHSGAMPTAHNFVYLRQGANNVARAMQHTPQLARHKALDIARNHGHELADVKSAIAAFMNKIRGQKVYDWRDVGDLESLDECCGREGLDTGTLYTGALAKQPHHRRTGAKGARFKIRLTRPRLRALYAHGHTNIKKAILAHGLLARLAHQTGELSGDGGWVIRSGDTAYKIAQKVAHDGSRWKEIVAVNPGMKIYTASNGSTQVKPWAIGQRITLPSAWLGNAAPVAKPAPVAAPSFSAPMANPIAVAAAQAAKAAPSIVPAVMISTPEGGDMISTATLQIELATFFQMHGPEVSVLPDAPVNPMFGLGDADLSGQMTDRTKNAIECFQVWYDTPGNGSSVLREDGVADQATVDALNAIVFKNLPVPAVTAAAPTAPTGKPAVLQVSYNTPDGLPGSAVQLPDEPGTVTLPEVTITADKPTSTPSSSSSASSTPAASKDGGSDIVPIALGALALAAASGAL